ncbi:S1 RNA-binding domain-containing protein [Caproicibacter sp. BJN0012]|uniref:S1 RNA-binding domain-containing protein n=1 Tax=Caproicibacter sp. BJN0012 TaxID=3110227 RepID=UPI002E143943|nr:S1 RNA-binding domain-containing protein [Caproicibacter sp. BJN0012]
MAKTKKSEKLEPNLTATEEVSSEMKNTAEDVADVLVPQGEPPVQLDDSVAGLLLSNADEPSRQPENEVLPGMDAGNHLPPDDEQSSGFAEQSQENPAEETGIPDKTPGSSAEGQSEPEPPKTRRTTRRKKADAISVAENSEAVPGKDSAETSTNNSSIRKSSKRVANSSVLTIESHAEVETPDDREEMIWHEIHNAYRTRKILTGTLGGIEQLETGKTMAIVYYKEMRIVIPMKEMMINLSQENSASYGEMMLRQNKILGAMLGAEIDFVVKGIDAKTRSVVASRRDAMLKKRQIFFMGTDTAGMYRIYENRIVQARVIAVADKVIRVEIFGVECSIMARDLSWDWLGDAHERFSVGDEILVRILNVKRDSLEDLSVKADVKSVTSNTGRENLSKCKVQGKYAGKVTDIHKGTVFVRLSIGVNAIAHSCYDNRMPGKKDDISFVVTHIDEEHGVAVGIITRIIKQNL